MKRNNASHPDIEAMIMTDEEIEELTRDIDFENIKMKAMNGIRKEKRTMKNNMRKTAIIAAAVVAIGGTVFAAEYFDAFKMFYGDRTNVTSEDKTSINNEQTASGVKMTVQEGIIGDKSAIIMVAFENEDGSTFPEDARVKTLDFQGEKEQSFGYMVSQQVTSDGSTLIGSFEIDTMDSIDGQNVIINADEIYEENTGKSLVTGPWKSTFQVDAKNSVHKEAVDIQIEQQEEVLALNQISISALGVEIEGKRLDAQKDRLPEYTPVVQIMTEDGKTTELYVSSTIETENGFKWQYNMDKDGNFIFIDDKEVKSVTIDGEVVDIKR